MVNNPFYGPDFKNFPGFLEKNISAQIRGYERQLTILKRILGAFAIFGFYFSVQYLLVEISVSGFGEYLNILFSDTREVLSLAPDFGILLLESLPVWGILGCLVCGIILASSARGFFRPLFR